MKTKITLTILIIFLLGFSLNVFAQDFPYITLDTDVHYGLAFSPDGKTLASLNQRSIQLWEVSTGKQIREFEPNDPNYPIYGLAFSPDGKMIAGGSRPGVLLWETSTGKKIHELDISHGSAAYGISFSPDGKTLASGSGYMVDLWETSTGNRIRTFRGHTSHVYSVSFSPDGKTIASGSGDRTIRLWETSTGRFLRTLTGHRGTVYSVSFSPDGKTIASAGYDGQTIRLWEASTGSQIRVPLEHYGTISDVAFSPDGKMIASASNRSTIVLWEASTGRLLHILIGNQNPFYRVAFSPDGKTLAGGGALHLWELPSARVSITPAAGVSPAVGDQLTVNVNIVGGKSVSAYQVQLEFDETALRHVSSANGNYLPSGAFFIPPVVETNKVTLSATALSGASDGDGRLATVTFEAVEIQKSFIDLLEVTLTDSQGGHLHQLAQNTRIEIYFPGDINSDGVVNIQDLVLVASSFGQSIEPGNPADLNGDGQVNVIDLVKIAGLLGSSAAAPSALAQAQETALKRSDVQQWLSQAQQLNLTDATAQSGIRFLEQLLTVLTPNETLLLANYPNPFNPETWIPYQLAESADVSLTIHAVDGWVVRTLTLGHQPVGIYQDKDRAAYWDGRNAQGEPVASGVYFYTLTAGEFKSTRKMLIRK